MSRLRSALHKLYCASDKIHGSLGITTLLSVLYHELKEMVTSFVTEALYAFRCLEPWYYMEPTNFDLTFVLLVPLVHNINTLKTYKIV